MKADLIIHNAGQLVTCAAGGSVKKGAAMRDLGIVENGAIAVVGKLIRAIGKSEDILADFESEIMVDAGGRVVMPAFVDPHTHIIYAGNRLDEFELKLRGADYLEILAGGGGILSTVRQTRNARSIDRANAQKTEQNAGPRHRYGRNQNRLRPRSGIGI
jgi:imidazolonepropionase